jgi:hypothetical protein
MSTNEIVNSTMDNFVKKLVVIKDEIQKYEAQKAIF